MSISGLPVAFDALTPLTLLERTVRVFPDQPAVVYGDTRATWAEFAEQVGRFAGALERAGVGPGDRVAVLAPNVPAALAAHFAVLRVRGVLVMINTRLAAEEIAYILDHSGAKIALVDPELAPRILETEGTRAGKPLFVNLEDPVAGVLGAPLPGPRFAEFVDGAPVLSPGAPVDDEQRVLSINYTSGTTGRPKGVMYTHRGALLNALGEILIHKLERGSVFLWTLPLFHCNGWCFPWAVTGAGGVHVMLRALDPARILDLLVRERVTHFNGAPTVLLMLAEAPEARGLRFEPKIRVATGGAPPSPTLLGRMEAMGISIIHLYGLTETYGPHVTCEMQPGWERLDVDGARGGDGAPGRAARRGDSPARGGRRDARRARRRRDDGRSRDAREQRDAGLLPRPGGHRAGLRGRLVPLRRSRRDAPGRLHRAARPQEGHHHQRRREHLDHRGRAHAGQAPGGARVRGGRHAPREVGRGAQGLRRPAPRAPRPASAS